MLSFIKEYWIQLLREINSERSLDDSFNFDSVSILGREKNDRKRNIFECYLHIIENVHAVNFKTDTARARVAYRSVIANCE